MVLGGFVDDSGAGHGKATVLAGFLSTADRWNQFSDELEELCDQEPKTPDFKMVKAADFRTYWPATRQQLDKRIEDVAALVHKHAAYRVDAIMSREAYEFIVKGRVPKEIDNPYFLLFHIVILSVATFLERMNLDAVVDFVFDEQGKVGRNARDLYEGIKKFAKPEVRRRMGEQPVFRHDKDLLPLKAADLYGWQIRRHLDKEQPQGIPHNEIVDEMIGRMLGVSCHIRPEDLRVFVANISHGIVLTSQCVYHVP